MGVITVEVPQSVEETYTIKSEAEAARIIETVRGAGKKKKRDLSSLVGLWSDRTESAEQIARELLDKSNSRRKQDDRGFDAALDAVVGIWSHREESTEDIARKLRAGWNRNNGK